MTQPPTTISFDAWTLHRESGELERGGARVRLQDVPLQILCELLDRPGEVVTREQLIARLWPKVIVDFDANLNSGVRRLRAALQDDADAPRYIETIPRKGYRYIGAAPSATPNTAPPEAPPVAVRRTRRLVWVSAAIGGLLLAGLALWPSMFKEEGRRAVDATPDTNVVPARRLRLAVLPFENLSPDPANAFFADGLHEEILSTIANRLTQVEVISRTTMMAYRNTPKPMREVAADLDATHVLEGSVRRDQDLVRLTLQLIDARNDKHLWSANFDRRLPDTMRLQSEVAADVSTQMAVKLSGNIGELPQSVNPEAFDLYLKARLSMQTATATRSPREQSLAEALLNRVIELDPQFSAAHVQRARVRMNKFVSSQDVSETNLSALRADLTAARKLIGDSPPLLASEAQYAQLVDLDESRALQLLRAAQSMNPNSSEVYRLLAQNLGSAGRMAESLAYFERAAQLDPGNPAIFADWASALKMAQRAGDSLRVSREFDARHPGLITYGWRLFGFTGQLDRFQSDLARSDGEGDPEASLAAHFDLLLFTERTAELGKLVERSGLKTIPQSSTGGFTIPAIGRKPVAELHGWAQLLARNATAAATDGRAVLEFVAHEPVTKWNAWYLRMLEAEGALFTGDKGRAIEATRQALAMAPRNIHSGIQRYSRALAARIFAWSGAEDEAVALLEQLSTQFPMIGPAEIARDPLYSTPLARSPKYQALASRLEAQITANRKLLGTSL